MLPPLGTIEEYLADEMKAAYENIINLKLSESIGSGNNARVHQLQAAEVSKAPTGVRPVQSTALSIDSSGEAIFSSAAPDPAEVAGANCRS